MRYRTKGSFSPAAQIAYESLSPTCASPGTWTVGAPYAIGIPLGEVSEMYDVVTSDWRKRQKAGDVIMNPMSSHTHIYASSGGQGFHARAVSPSCSSPLRFAEAKRDGDQLQSFVPRNISTGRMVIETAINSSDVTSLITECATACLNQRGRSDSNLWESFAEIDKSLEMHTQLANGAKKIVDKTIQYRGSRPQKGRYASAAGDVASMYLLYRYGLSPIMSDVVNVFEGLAQGDARVRKSSRAVRTKFAQSNETYNHVHGSFTTTIMKQKSDSVIVRAVSLDEYTMDALSSIGFTTKGLVTLPWELMRLSFVIDWWLNIGDLLGALSPTPGYTQLGSCQTIERVTTNSYTSLGTICHDGTNIVLRPVSGTVSGTVRSKMRSALAPPGLIIKSDFKFDNLTRALDATALVVQALSRLKGLP